jgi:hypothetical protein
LRKLTDNWRSTTARLIMIYGTFFALWGGVVIGADLLAGGQLSGPRFQ